MIATPAAPPDAEAPPGEFFAYADPRPGTADELLDPAGHTRPHWLPFLQSIAGLGLPELLRRWAEARDLIRENGVTYNVYGDPNGTDRPWQLDPLPLLLSAPEFATVETGLRQRGRLLEAVLADIYGPQRALRAGLLPPELVFDHPGFLRPCHGMRLPGGRSLHLFACDLGRGPDGSFHVLGDRTQSPSGAGYTLENRLVLARTLPEAFRDCRVERLALFFRTFRETLRASSPRNRDNPRIVLLTPGPYNETYFEHAYLARYLGLTLVEGGDLTVRDNRVFLRVLGGLQPVDVIFRRLDDDFCDPLELRADSFLGVPGLVQAVRSGNVAVANALGTGLLDMPALLAFLPGLCRFLLGEPLQLPSVSVWWCGDSVGLSHVLANLGRLVIKPAFRNTRQGPVFGERLSAAERQALADRIRAKPRDFVGEEPLPLSTAPVFVGDSLQPRHVVWRAFLAADGDGFAVMPGGLTRAGATPDTLVVSMQKGGGSKDTWVLATGPVSDFTMLRPAGHPVELSRGGSDLPSRSADNLFWLGRYAERAEGLVRLLRGVLARMTEKTGLGDVPELPVLLRALTVQAHAWPGFIGPGADARLAAPEAEVLALVFDAGRPGSLAATLNAVYRIAGTVRDRISADMWRVMNGLELRQAPARADRRTLSDVLDLLNQTVTSLSALGGLVVESMTRGQAWRFLDMGRRLERAFHTITLLASTMSAVSPNEVPLLEALLEIADSAMTYRRRYLSSLQAAPVLDLLLADETNPRSLAFQLAALGEHVEHLPRDAARAGRSPEERIMMAALTTLRLADIEELSRSEACGVRSRLEDLLNRLTGELPALSDALTREFLNHLQPSRQLSRHR